MFHYLFAQRSRGTSCSQGNTRQLFRICIYIYIYIEREREIYTYTHTHIDGRGGARRRAGAGRTSASWSRLSGTSLDLSLFVLLLSLLVCNLLHFYLLKKYDVSCFSVIASLCYCSVFFVTLETQRTSTSKSCPLLIRGHEDQAPRWYIYIYIYICLILLTIILIIIIYCNMIYYDILYCKVILLFVLLDYLHWIILFTLYIHVIKAQTNKDLLLSYPCYTYDFD